jgi:hypothetical protein
MFARRVSVTELFRPAAHAAQRVVPQRVHLDGLAVAWRHHPVADLGVHPRELHTGLACAKQPVGPVDTNPVSRAIVVPLDDSGEYRIEVRQQAQVVGGLEIAFDRVEIPQRGVDRVELGGLIAVREAIG